MELRQRLIEGFEYDFWANRRWLYALGGFNQSMTRAQEVLEHIHLAQLAWLARCGKLLELQQENLAVQDLYERTFQAWCAFIEEHTGEEVFHYVTLELKRFANTLEEVCLHVVNHGTYHRGQLRALAEADGFQGFPETDLIDFYRERQRS